MQVVLQVGPGERCRTKAGYEIKTFGCVYNSRKRSMHRTKRMREKKLRSVASDWMRGGPGHGAVKAFWSSIKSDRMKNTTLNITFESFPAKRLHVKLS